MDVDQDLNCEELIKMAQDRDSWKMRVKGLKIKSKVESWKATAAEKKTLLKQLKNKIKTTTQPKSCFKYGGHCKLPQERQSSQF